MNAPLLALLDALPVGCLVLDPTFRIHTINKTLESLLGFHRSEVVGLPCRYVLRSRLCVQNCPHTNPVATGGRTDCISRHRQLFPIQLTPVHTDTENGPLILDIVEDLSTIHNLEARLNQAASQDILFGRCPAMERILALVPIVGGHNVPVLLWGETGTGKSRLAQAIHNASPRKREPFVRFSCGPMSEEFFEAELFGRVLSTRADLLQGRFQQAQGGTLYLAEVDALPQTVQTRLVRFLDEGIIQPQGATQTTRIDVRIIASTTTDPNVLVAKGILRHDLVHRLATVQFHLPPLRERGEDKAFLLQHFLEHFSRRLKKSINGISPKARAMLHAYTFPGNVRELKNVMEFAVLVCPGGNILPEHLPGHLGPKSLRQRTKD
jgi:transcriptional regulator with PAS, ATPase and Fis domain